MFRTISFAAAALVASASMATAADLYIPETPIAYDEATGFDWEGAYAGARVRGLFGDEDFYDGTLFGLGVALGYNFLPADAFVLGLELRGDYVFGNDDDDVAPIGEISLMGRAGVLATDDVLVYALGTIGQAYSDDFDPEVTYSFGAGIELAVSDDMTVRGEVAALNSYDDDESTAMGTTASLGAFWHF
ncbi:outer membrane protein [Devosia sp.]|uniref:outer membrane protein n=1 Tax=Devosia sp. TaxID=1871048 RepID=UPI003A8D350A